MKSTLMRRLSILLVLAMVLAMLPVGAMAADYPDTLYLQPNSYWTQASARFAAYFFNASGNTWADMSDADGDGIYEVTVPTTAEWTHVIFCRMNPNDTTNSWNTKWNQTADLAMPTDGTNCYAVAANTWDNGGGAWSAYTVGDEVTEATTAPKNYSYYLIGDMNTWTLADDTLGMTDTDGDGVYTVVVALEAGSYEYKINVGDWSQSWGNGDANYSVSLATACDVTFSLNPTTGEVTATGDGLGEAPTVENPIPEGTILNVKGTLPGLDWDAASEAGLMTLVDGVYTLTIADVPASEVGADPYAFKIMFNNSWDTAYPENDWTFYLTDVCDVTITMDATYQTINVTADYLTYDAPTDGGETTEDTWHVKGDVAGLDWDLTTGTGAMTKNEDGSYSLTIADVAAANKYSVKAVKNSSWDGAAGGMGAGGNYEFSVSAACDVTFTVSAEGVLSVTGDNVADPVASEIVVDAIYVAGGAAEGSTLGNFLYGQSWVFDSSVNVMYLEEGSTTVYTITYSNVEAGTYNFRFYLNGTSATSYASGVEIVSGEAATAWYNPSGDSSVVVAEDGSTVTLVLDMTNVSVEGDNAEMTVTVEAPAAAPESSAPSQLVIGANDFVIAAGDTNLVSSTFTATADGVLNIIPSAMASDPYMTGTLETVPAEYINMQFMRGYAIMVDGVNMYLPISIEVVAGTTYEIGVMSYQGVATEVTLTLCDNHSMVYSFNETTYVHSVACATCGLGATTAGEAGKPFKINSAYLTLASDISIIYRCTIPEGFNNAYVVFTDINGNETTAFSEGTDSNGRHLFRYEGVDPHTMGDSISATLYANLGGYEVTNTVASYSVLKYCTSQLGKNPTAAFKTLISDLLVYGAKAQAYVGYNTDTLVTAGLEETLTPSTFPGVDSITNKQSVTGTATGNADVKSAALALSNKVYLKLGFTVSDDISLYTYRVTIGDEVFDYTSTSLTEGSDRYYLEFDEFGSNQFDETITVIVLKDGEQVSRTLEYSVNTYIKKNADETAFGQVLQAVYNYGVAAKAYAG